MTQAYMVDFFKRNMMRPNQDLELPSYLKPFKVEEQEEDPH